MTIQCELREVPRLGRLHEVLGSDAEALRDLLGTLTQQEPPVAFPGPNPVSIDTSHFGEFGMQPYLLAEKTDGVRVCLMACMYKGHDVCVLFDRKLIPYIFLLQCCPKPWFGGTVMDGELVREKDSGTPVLSLFDAAIIGGIPIFRSLFSRRLEAIRASMTFYTHTATDTAHIECKPFLFGSEPDDVIYLHLQQRAKRFATDGIIFMPEFDPIVIGRHDRLFKLKTHHTLDFMVRGGKLYVYDEKNKRNKCVGVPTGSYKHLAVDGAIVECDLDPAAGPKKDAWNVLGVRTDKKSSNTKYVFDKTLLNIKEALTLENVPFRLYEKNVGTS